MTQVVRTGITIETDNNLSRGEINSVAFDDDPNQVFTLFMSANTLSDVLGDPEVSEERLALMSASWHGDKADHMKKLSKKREAPLAGH